ncbi:hypothetical protein ATSB10_06210 [Dyella thiooxydans]|uniref:Uncharacterized protein n=1 Tax=Dyella thiooxydans TaxID=445710 RepID=A0A169GPK1_9GAMM|nr:hypothetical protein [Dyella thiooxydans]AND68075.1 hypothetical protein ATSB10_06210 [Dyella thiooxydans]
MPNISYQTLICAIQAVSVEIRSLRAALADGDAMPEDYQLIEDWQRAADDLERAYDEAARTVLNLPPYDELVGG